MIDSGLICERNPGKEYGEIAEAILRKGRRKKEGGRDLQITRLLDY